MVSSDRSVNTSRACVHQSAYSPASILDKAHICKHILTDVTAETVWVPAVIHSLDDTANNELT